MLLDDSHDRRRALALRAFDVAVEAARAGAIFARDQKQYTRWRSAEDRRSGQRPAHASTTLEQLALDYPDHVGRPN
jgi:hypothetical protein